MAPSNPNAPGAVVSMCQMPRYKSLKEVWALKIELVQASAGDHPAEEGEETDGGGILTPVNKIYAPMKVDAKYMKKHEPKAGGYYVQYKDGYESFSPAEPFEEGYTKVS